MTEESWKSLSDLPLMTPIDSGKVVDKVLSMTDRILSINALLFELRAIRAYERLSPRNEAIIAESITVIETYMDSLAAKLYERS